MELDSISVFVKVVQAGSFSQAARLLGMPKTTVSAKVALLEKRLGATLIQRTTRKLNITQAGEAYFRRCVQALDELKAAESEVTSNQNEAQGMLRITASVDMGHTLLPSLVREFVKKNPKMEVDLVITNRVVDLVGEGIDIGIRAGELEDSSMIAKRFVGAGMEVYATPAYLKKFGTPQTPKDLEDHEFIRFSELGTDRLPLNDGKSIVQARVKGRILADDPETVKVFTLMGDGIGVFPSFICEDEIRKGKLVRVLPKWRLGSGHFSLVYPAQKFVPHKIRAFLDAADEFTKQCASVAKP